MEDFAQHVRDELDAYMDHGIANRTHLGLSFAFHEKEQTHFWNYGSADPKGHQLFNENSLLEIGSVGKVFTSLLFSKLIREGLCHADDSVQKFLPEIPNEISINLLQLLNHRSGLNREPDNFFLKAPLNSYLPYRNEHLLEALRGLKKPAVQGRFSYSSFGYLILGLVAERISGVSDFSKLTTETLLVPLQLDSTRYRLRDSDHEIFCPGYDEHLMPVSYGDLGEVYDAAGGIKSTVADLSKVLGWMLRPETSPHGFREDFAKITELAECDDEVTASFGLHRRKFNHGIGYFHLGSLAGTKTALLFSLTLQRGIVYCSNTLAHVEPRWKLLFGNQ